MFLHKFQFSFLIHVVLYLPLEATDDDGLDNEGRLTIGISLLVLVTVLVCGTVLAVVVLKASHDIRKCKFTQTRDVHSSQCAYICMYVFSFIAGKGRACGYVCTFEGDKEEL